MRIKIKVTKADISNGQPSEIDACPIALAARRVFKKVEQVEVDEYLSIFPDDADYVICSMPKKAHEFIQEFDMLGKKVKPFEFCIEVDKGFYKRFK